MDRRAPRRRATARRVAHEIRVEERVVRDDEDAVAASRRDRSRAWSRRWRARRRNAASVFSGARPRAPRWPCRSNASVPAAPTRRTRAVRDAKQRHSWRASHARTRGWSQHLAIDDELRHAGPTAHRRCSSSPVVAMLWKHSSVQHSECGVTITLSIASSGLSASTGSCSNTSSAAPAMRPSLQRRDQRGLVDDRPARHVDEVGGPASSARIAARRSGAASPRRAAESSTTKSESRSSVSRSTLRAPR